MAGERTRWRPWFLEELAKRGNIARACRVAGVARGTAYRMRERDPKFAAAWDFAYEKAADALEEEARRRAVEGVPRLKFTRSGLPIIDPKTGEPYVEWSYSDQLLKLLLQGHRPERFRDRVEHTGPKGGPLQVQQLPLDLTQLSDEDLAHLERILGGAPPDPEGGWE
jgi:hypothetical protein